MASITTAGSGNWSSTTANAPWPSGIVPVLGDKVTIAAGHTVTLDGTYSCGDDTTTALNISGTLSASRSVSSQITVRGQIAIANNGVWDFGTIASPIPNGVNATLLLNDSAAPAVAKYGMSSVAGGICHFHGLERTRNTRLNGTVSAGVTSIVVNDATNWQVGDTIFIGPTNRNTTPTTEGEIRVIAGTYTPGSTTVPLTAALTYSHATTVAVSNCTSNVRVANSNNTYPGYVYLTYSPVNSAGEITLRHTWIDNFGNNSAANVMNQGFQFLVTGQTATMPKVVNDVIGVAYYQTLTGSRNNFVQFSNQDVVTYSDIACICTGASGTSGAYLPNGVCAIFNNSVFFSSAGIALSTSYSQGGQACVFNNCDVISGNNQSFYINIGIDGSLVDSSNGGEITSDFANVQIDVNDGSDNTFDSRRGYSWWRYITQTSSGIAQYNILAISCEPDEYNILVDGSLQIENVKSSPLTITNGVWKRVDGVTLIASTSNTIYWVPNDRVYTASDIRNQVAKTLKLSQFMGLK